MMKKTIILQNAIAFCATLATIQLWEVFTASIMIIAYFYILLICLFIQRRAFHPFFVISFGLLILSYALYPTFQLIFMIFTQLKWTQINMVVQQIWWPIYYIMVPLNVNCTLERLLATVYYAKYERMRPWALLLIPGIVVPVYTFLAIGRIFGVATTAFINWSVYGGSGLSFVILSIVAATNVYRTLQLGKAGTNGLTARFQLAENIRTAQISLSYVLLDNIIKLYDIFWNGVFTINALFDRNRCAREGGGYVALQFGYLIIRFTMALNYALVLTMLAVFLMCLLERTFAKPMLIDTSDESSYPSYSDEIIIEGSDGDVVVEKVTAIFYSDSLEYDSALDSSFDDAMITAEVIEEEPPMAASIVKDSFVVIN
ncbi:unnamed protein product, partial [Mesorhabditis spiculigera]